MDSTAPEPSPEQVSQAKALGQSHRVRRFVSEHLDADGSAFVLASPELDGAIIYASQSFLRLTQYDLDEVIGRNCRFLQGPSTDLLSARRIGESLRSGQEITIQLLNYRKNGDPFWNSLFISRVELGQEERTDEGSETPVSPPAPMQLYLGIQTDITAARALQPAPPTPTRPLVTAARKTTEPIDIPPCESPMNIAFSDITYSVPVIGDNKERKMKQILFGIDGHIMAGNSLAIMGPSGSGKTTLLNILAGRTTERIGGELTVNGAPYTKNVKRRLGFIMQDDVLFSELTVRETLHFTAELRMPAGTTPQQRTDRVEQILDILSLQKAADTKVGDALSRGVSGGERKRLNIGVELINDPSLLLLDEPTSGLDSSTALSLLLSLSGLADAGRSIITSIHQPSSQIFQSFDLLLLLAEGHTVYFGPAADAVKYFAGEPLNLVCPTHYNPADYFMEIATGETRRLIDNWKAESKELETAAPAQVEVVVEGDAESKASDEDESAQAGATETIRKHLLNLSTREINRKTWRTMKSSSALAARPSSTAASTPTTEGPRWPTTFWQQLSILTRRTLKQNGGTKIDMLTSLQYVALTIIVSWLWWQIDNTASSIPDREGVIFFVLVFNSFSPAFVALVAFPAEEAILRKERASGTYRLSAYFLSKSVADLFITLLYPAVMAGVVYWCVNLRGDLNAFLAHMGIILLNVLTAESFGILVATTFMNFRRSLIFMGTITLAFMLAGGFYVQNIPDSVAWIGAIGFISYAYKPLLRIEFNDDRLLECVPGEPVDFASCPVTGKMVTDRLDGPGLTASLIVLACMMIGFRIASYFALRFKTRVR